MSRPPSGLAQTPSAELGADMGAGLVLLSGMAALLVPSLWRLSQEVWTTEGQGQGPVILAISSWLAWRRWPALRALKDEPTPASRAQAWGGLLLALILYVLGRSQSILMLEAGSLILMVSSLLLMHRGWKAVRLLGFALFFLMFIIPLPESLVAAATAPLKSAVSMTAAWLLQRADLPVGRSGVMITAGPYQLLVADACAGLTTLFTLEALGLLYLHLAGHTLWLRNAMLAVMVIPISFMANVLRVMALVLITLVFGDAVGQGFAHQFAGLLLFGVGLLLMLTVDGLIGMAFRGLKLTAPAA